MGRMAGEEGLISTFSRHGFERITIPDIDSTASNELKRAERKTGEINKKKAELKKELSSISKKYYSILSASKEYLDFESSKFTAESLFGSTGHTFILEAYLPEKNFGNFEKFAKENFGKEFFLKKIGSIELDKHHEQTPTLLENPKMLAPFEFMTKFMALPRSNEIDPTIIFLFFFPVFYGMMVGDVFYGLISFLLAFLIVKKTSPDGMLNPIGKIWMWSAIPTILFGIIFDEFAGMPHEKIFEMWNSLKKGESLRIINDHEPKPLYYQFEAEYKGLFKWNYEKQGPEDWIFTIKRVSDKIDRKQEIKSLIKQLKIEGDVSRLKEKAKATLKNISPTDLGIIEQEIIKEGTTREEMRKLCDVHLEVMKDSLNKPETKLKSGHPIHTLMEEHKMILDFIEKLKETVRKINVAKSFDGVSVELKMLEHIAEHLVEADKHHQREEEVLFPMLKKFGVTEPPEIMREEHEELKPKKKELYKTAKEYGEMP